MHPETRPTSSSATPATDASHRSDAALPRNRLLRALPCAERATLRPHLEPVRLEPQRVLADADAESPHVYFPESGSISLVTRLQDGTCVEHGAVGREGIAGLTAVLGPAAGPSVLMGQTSGTAFRVDAATFGALVPSLPGLGLALHRYAAFLIAQVAQLAACNTVHAVEQRCARWLLMAHDQIDGDTLALTHEALAHRLAVRRAGVSEAAEALRDRGMIQYRRGRLVVLDRARLEAAACECYGIVRAQRERLLGALES